MAQDVSSVQQSRITATLDGMALGIFEDRGEFEVTAPDGKYRLGGMGAEKALGGKASLGSLTVTRIFDTLAQTQRKTIRGRVGKGALVVKEQPLDDDETPIGEPDVWSGRLVGYTQAGRSASGDDPMTYTLTCAVETLG